MAAILVVEDDAAIAELLHDALRDAGYVVAVAPDHAAALAVLGAARFALVLADTAGVAHADRWAALEALRDAAAPAPVALCTAHDPTQFPDHAARGFAALVRKPFDLAELEATVARLLADGAGRRCAC